MRYTEARLEALGDEMMTDLDKETVDFVPNYDETTEEPSVLPAPFPNLLVNGSAGHRRRHGDEHPAAQHARGDRRGHLDDREQPGGRAADACREAAQAAGARCPVPTSPPAATSSGGTASSRRTSPAAARSSCARRPRSRSSKKGDRSSIVIAEIPYQVNKARLIERIADLVREKTIEGISDIRDESDRDGMRIVIDLKRGEVGEVILNNLYKHTALQSSFGIIMLAIVGGRPKVLSLLELIDNFIEFRREVVRRRTEFELRKAEARRHILEGLKIALDHLDAVIALIRAVEESRRGARRPDRRSSACRRFRRRRFSTCSCSA